MYYLFLADELTCILNPKCPKWSLPIEGFQFNLPRSRTAQLTGVHVDSGRMRTRESQPKEDSPPKIYTCCGSMPPSIHTQLVSLVLARAARRRHHQATAEISHHEGFPNRRRQRCGAIDAVYAYMHLYWWWFRGDVLQAMECMLAGEDVGQTPPFPWRLSRPLVLCFWIAHTSLSSYHPFMQEGSSLLPMPELATLRRT